MNLKRNLHIKQKEINKEINALEKYINNLPDDKLIVRQKNGNYYYSKKKFKKDVSEKEPSVEHFLNSHPGIKELLIPSLKNPNEYK